MSGTKHAPSGPRLVLATRNQGKLRELRELLRGKVPGLDVDTQVIDAETAGLPPQMIAVADPKRRLRR